MYRFLSCSYIWTWNDKRFSFLTTSLSKKLSSQGLQHQSGGWVQTRTPLRCWSQDPPSILSSLRSRTPLQRGKQMSSMKCHAPADRCALARLYTLTQNTSDREEGHMHQKLHRQDWHSQHGWDDTRILLHATRTMEFRKQSVYKRHQRACTSIATVATT